MSLTTELNQLYAQMSSQSANNPSNGIEGILPTQTPAPVVPEVTPTVTSTPTPNVEPKETTTAASEPVITTPKTTQVVDVDLADDWDDSAPLETQTVAVTPTPATQSFDFSTIAKALGDEKISNQEELLNLVNTTKSKVDLLNNIPEPLAKAIEIANLNGDYLSFLGVSQIDWSKEDPVVLYENYVINQFTDPNTGTVDFERVDKLLDKIDDDEKDLRGRELQKNYISQQAYQKSQIEQQAKIQRQNFENELKRSIDNLSDISGYKLTPAHKQELYSYIVKGEDLKETDISKRVQNAFIKKNFSKIDAFRKQQIRNSVKKEILEEAVMPDIKPVTSTPDTTPSTGYTMESFLKELESKQKRKF